MPRNYKTGPRRSRRRPDPSSIAKPGQLIYPLSNTSATGGIGTMSVSGTPFDPTTGSAAFADEFDLTGQPTTVRFVGDNGEVYTPDVTWDQGTGIVTFEVTSGMVAGNYVAATNSLDPSVRNNNGGWLGSIFEVAVVT